jgi:uncharacterized protein
MKYLILLAVVLAIVWYWRKAREPSPPRTGAKPGAAPLPQDMVECPVCRVHLPRSDALQGPGGQVYCCADHARTGG